MKRSNRGSSLAMLLVAAVGAGACQSRTDAAGNPTMGKLAAKHAVQDVTIGHQLAADGTIAANQQGKSFAPGATVYVAFDITKAPPGTSVELTWFGPDNQPLGSDTETARAGQTYMNFASPDTSTWAKGDYRAEIKAGDSTARTDRFNIVEPGKEDRTPPNPGKAANPATPASNAGG